MIQHKPWHKDRRYTEVWQSDDNGKTWRMTGMNPAPGEPELIAGLTPAEHEDWVEEAHGKNPAPLTYTETAQLLRAKLDRSEFLALQELLDGDADHSLSEEISKLAAEMAPELFGCREKVELQKRVLQLIASYRWHPSVKLLNICYGLRAVPLRTQVLAVLLGRKVTGSDKEVQWGNFRDRMWALVGAEGNCIAANDHDFETKAKAILRLEEEE